MGRFIAASLLLSLSTVTYAAAPDGPVWEPLSTAFKSNWEVPKSYLMGGVGYMNAESKDGTQLSGTFAQAGIGLKIGRYFAIETRALSGNALGADGANNESADVFGFGSGVTAYMPLGRFSKGFVRYDYMSITSTVNQVGGTEREISSRVNAVGVGVEGRIRGKNYIRATYEVFSGEELDGDFIELSVLRRM